MVSYVYDAFGTLIEQTGIADNSITYAGYQYDYETGLYYVNARYYDSITARFLTEDTYRGRINDPLSLNRYTYCHNNPVSYYDPSGHFAIGAFVATVVIGAVVGAAVDVFSQKVVEKKDNINWKSVGFEAGIGALSAGVGFVTGGVGTGAAAVNTVGKSAAKTTVKSVAGKALKTGAISATSGFATDVAKQVIVDDKNLKEVDYKKAATTSAVAGVTGAIGSAAGSVSKIVKDKIKPKANVKIADDVADGMNSMTTKASNSAKKTTGKADILPENKISSAMNPTGNADVVKKQMAGIGTDSSGQAFKMDLQLFGDKDDRSFKTRDLFRAVSPEEYEDVLHLKRFRGIEGRTLGAKEFGNVFEETLDFANKSINRDKAAIMKVTIPEKIYKQLNHMNLDANIFKSGTPVVEPDMLDIFNESIIKIEHFY